MRGGMLRRKQNNSNTSNPQGNTPEAGMAARLLELCGGNAELYQTLARTMILDPKKINMPVESFLNDARDFESHGNKLRAEVAYRVAGALSLYQGNVEAARTYFSKAFGIGGNSRSEYQSLMNHLDEAVAVTRKYYATV